jgi:hypothetical protein
MQDKELEQKLDVPDELKIPLRKPVTLGDETHEFLLLKAPTTDQIERFQKDVDRMGPLPAMNNWIATMAGVNRAVVGLTDGRDSRTAREYLQSFL